MKLGTNPNLNDDDEELEFQTEIANYTDDIAEDEDLITEEQLATEQTKGIKKDPAQAKGRKVVLIFVAIIALLIIGFFGSKLLNKSSNEVNEAEEDNLIPTPISSDYIPQEDLIVDGVEIDGELVDPADIVQALDGTNMKKNFKVTDIEFKRDMVNYVKKRAQTDEGMEFFWLDIVYKDKQYKVQIPYHVYRDLDKKGIVVVSMEILKSKDQSVISYMEVVQNYKELIGSE